MLRDLQKHFCIMLMFFLSSNIYANDIQKSEFTIKSGQSLMQILNKAGVDKTDTHNLVYKTKNIKNITNLEINNKLTIYKNTNNTLIKLIYEKSPEKLFVATRLGKNKFQIKKARYNLNEVNRYKIGKVTYSVNKTLSEMGLSKEQKDQFKEMFQTQLNLNKVYKGTEILVSYNEYYKGSKKLYDGELLAGEIISGTNTYNAFLYKDHKNNKGYFTNKGTPLSEGFDRTPLKSFKRVSSKFSKGRKHPVLGIVRPHNGVDYAAKTGTPIYAAASGKIALKDYQKKGYGHVIVINHKDGYSTLYAHMKSTAKGVYSGKKVNKGDLIGYVGSTGISTGPHLHFEIRKNGRYLDPETTKVPTGSKLAKKDVFDFSKFVKKKNQGFSLTKVLNKKEGKTTIAVKTKRK